MTMLQSVAVAALAALLVGSSQAINLSDGGQCRYYINYTTVTGYFLQDEPSTNATSFDYTATNFGLINRTYPSTAGSTANLTQWQQFELEVDALNAAAPLNTAYKVLFMGRHGEGWHNAAQTFYGTPGWNCYWAELNGNATVSWEDAHLDPAGVAQAQIANNFWRHEIAVQKIPVPQSYYVSPLTRCLQTANVTFFGLDLPVYYPFIPTVKELLREGISIHTCDHRLSRTYIHNLFPHWNIEPGFSELDELWNGYSAETSAAQDARSQKWLDQVFSTDDHTWISVTSHSGEIASTLQVLGHQAFSLNTGAVIPVLVKAKFLPLCDAPSSTAWAWTKSTHCAAPPQTSISSLSQGCVCTKPPGPVTTPLVDDTQNTHTAGPTAYPGPNC